MSLVTCEETLERLFDTCLAHLNKKKEPEQKKEDIPALHRHPLSEFGNL
jgi:hypothetical protein